MATSKTVDGYITQIGMVDPFERFVLKLLRRGSRYLRYYVHVDIYRDKIAMSRREKVAYFFSDQHIGIYKFDYAVQFHIGQRVRAEVVGNRILKLEQVDNAPL